MARRWHLRNHTSTLCSAESGALAQGSVRMRKKEK
ncbi:hypothetical protein PSYAE_26675 [Pseudomonas amygdali pv. aesculi str. 0893_23]|nr:hypothetical protein PSYAE_26675 [Pseudomonas amygdali pv. aesculi str. 0893_23]